MASPDNLTRRLAIETTARQKQASYTGLAVLALVLALAGTPLNAADPAEQGLLAVFVQPDRSEVSRTFAADHLPRIRELAKSMEIPVKVFDASKGCPPDVKMTPLLVYQNFRGRSIYQGRYTTINRVNTFLRTARHVPQGNDARQRVDIPVRTAGRAKVISPLKITSLDGTAPADYNATAFAAEARKAIGATLREAEMRATVEVGRADRFFYMDFYPGIGDEGEFKLAVALFSQFHCEKPVFTNWETPFVGQWSARDDLFRRGTKALEEAITASIRGPESGDGFDPVGNDVPTRSWQELGLALPAAPATNKQQPVDAALARRWTVAAATPADPPRVQFRFPPPLDGYVGEALSVSGELELDDDLGLLQATGKFTAETASLTMGEDDLDDTIRGSVFLDGKKHPTSTFVIRDVTAQDGALAFGRLTPAELTGNFTMKGKTEQLTVRAEFEPVVNDQGEVRLVMNSGFELDLRTFDVPEADGPPPANHTLLFDVRLTLQPAE